MKLPKYEGNDIAEASAQFAALMKEAEGLVAASQARIVEIQVGVGAPCSWRSGCWVAVALLALDRPPWPHPPCPRLGPAPAPPTRAAPHPQAEIGALQQEKERIATTTIDDELAADPKTAAEVDAEVGVLAAWVWLAGPAGLCWGPCWLAGAELARLPPLSSPTQVAKDHYMVVN